MRQYKHLLAFDLSSYGGAFAILNKYADDEDIKVFEVSPVGTAGVLILIARDFHALSLVMQEAQRLFGGVILESALIENFNEHVLNAYLSQNKPILRQAFAFFEMNSVAVGIRFADTLLRKGIELVDFRVIRTAPMNVVITASADSVESFAGIENEKVKATFIEKAEKTLKSYFELN